MKSTRALGALVTITAMAVTASGCSVIGGDSADDSSSSSSKVVLVTHDSFTLPKPLIRKFEQQSGYDLVVKAEGDAGQLTNKLVLTKDDPLGDVAFGVDNTFASRALEAGVFAPYSWDEPAGVSDYALPGDDAHALTPVDNGDVCVNVDDTWFKAHHQAPPRTMDDLTDPAYKGEFVLPGAATSSTGLAFLLATIAKYGDGWQGYWSRLMANDAEITSGWEQAYEVDFTQGGGKGDRPIVLSYDSSPAYTVPKGSSSSTTSALLDTCFRQVEYAGVLAGAANPKGAQAFVRFLDSQPAQAALPTSMYVFPVVDGVPLPKQWAKFAVQPDHPYTVDPADVAAHRAEWLQEWSDVTSR
ncbi:thiamine ABC transporter substrate-binding protein [Nocardioides panaciterrulae]|uniref:Thiamine transport system substrate-binding protein n=1 Tax=Nocardioides panaciterrulae TaxID=661492 RepID=A0A7Y9E9A7_9ACTN|nr:thiamine transport system substrate-binding protein [Nocardioides panaciterrulae]